MTDPWQIRNTSINQSVPVAKRTEVEHQGSNFGFEDNFPTNISDLKLENTLKNIEHNSKNCSQYNPLPDSTSYLETLQRKLQGLKKNCKLVEALGEKRQQSLRALLQNKEQITSSSDYSDEIELNVPIPKIDSAVQGIYRHFQPVHGLSVGEVVPIIKYDKLEEIQEQSKDFGCI